MATVNIIKNLAKIDPSMIDILIGSVFGVNDVKKFSSLTSYVKDQFVYVYLNNRVTLYKAKTNITAGTFNAEDWEAITIVNGGGGIKISDTEPMESSVSMWVQPIRHGSADFSAIMPEMDPSLITREYIYNSASYAYENLPELANVSNTTVRITDIDVNISGIFALPETIDGFNVTSISNSACAALTSLTQTKIPTSITLIGTGIFEGCTALTNVHIGTGISGITSAMFRSTGLTSITLPPNITSIADDAFATCTALTTITILNVNMTFGNNIFLNSGLTTIIGYPGSTAEIFANANGYTFQSV